jgi:hypothetical protein
MVQALGVNTVSTKGENSNKKPDKVNDISLFIGDSQNLPDGKLAITYIVLKALDKDKLAIALLDAAGYVAYDTEGNQIYPPQPKKDEQNG